MKVKRKVDEFGDFAGKFRVTLTSQELSLVLSQIGEADFKGFESPEYQVYTELADAYTAEGFEL